MRKIVMLITVMLMSVFASEGRFKLGYAGTYSDGISQHGAVIGGGAITDTKLYIGGDASFEVGRETISTTIEGYDYGYGYSSNDTTFITDISIKTITPSLIVGHKFIRFKVGVPISIISIDGDSDYDDSMNDTKVGVSFGAQTMIPIVDGFNLFVEPDIVIIDSNGAFGVRA